MTLKEKRDAALTGAVAASAHFPEKIFCGGAFYATPRAIDAANELLAQAVSGKDNVVFPAILKLVRSSKEVELFDIVKRLPVMFDTAFTKCDAASGTESDVYKHLLEEVEVWAFSVSEDARAFVEAQNSAE